MSGLVKLTPNSWLYWAITALAALVGVGLLAWGVDRGGIDGLVVVVWSAFGLAFILVNTILWFTVHRQIDVAAFVAGAVRKLRHKNLGGSARRDGDA